MSNGHKPKISPERLRNLIASGKTEKAINELRDFSRYLDDDLRTVIINASEDYQKLRRDRMLGILTHQEEMTTSSKITVRVLESISQIQKNLTPDSDYTIPEEDIRHLLDENKLQTPQSKAEFERKIGSHDEAVRIAWLAQGMAASKSVCRILLPNGTATGFLLKGHYLMTNNHVFENQEMAGESRVEFNFRREPDGTALPTQRYAIDPSFFLTNDKNDLDYSLVKLKDKSEAPLKDWGYLTPEDISMPQQGEPVTIIHHPEGKDMHISLTANQVISQMDHYLFYETDTQRGSSGSPVFNKEWKLIAIHSAGQTMEADGRRMKVNEQGEERDANRGILIKDIFRDVKKQLEDAGKNPDHFEFLNP